MRPTHPARPILVRSSRILLALVVTLLGGGCLVGDATLTLKPDGSGSISLTYSMDEDTGTSIKGVLGLRESVARDANARFTPSAVDHWIDLLVAPRGTALATGLEAYRKMGLYTETAAVTSADGRRKAQIRLLFTNVADLAKVDIFPHLGLSISTASVGSVQIRRVGKPVPDDMVALLADPNYLAQVQPLFTGFLFRLAFNSPSPILAANGTTTTPSRVEWLYSYDNDPAQMVKLQYDELRVAIDARGIAIPALP